MADLETVRYHRWVDVLTFSRLTWGNHLTVDSRWSTQV